MRVTNSLSFYCRPSKAGRDGLAPLEVSISVNGQRVFVNIPIKFKPTEFNRKRRDPKINAIIDSIRNNSNEAIQELLDEGLPITAATLRDKMKNGGTVSKTLSTLFTEYLAYIRPRVGHNMTEQVYHKYELVGEKIVSFFGDKEIVSIKPTDLESFYNSLKSDYKTSSSGAIMTKIKTVFSYAFTNGYIRSNPCGLLKIEKGQAVAEYLTTEEVDKLISTPLPANLEKVRIIALTQLYTGTAYCDAQKFDVSKCNEVNGILLYTSIRQKTKIRFTAIVIPKVKDILEPYNGKCPKLPNQVVNRYLKQIAFICGIEKNLHSHLFRKTYATMLLSNGIPMSTISTCLGHTNSIITQKVYAFTNEQTIAEQAQILFK